MCRRRAPLERKLARLRQRRVRMLKKPSIGLSQDALVGMKWKPTRGWAVNQHGPRASCEARWINQATRASVHTARL